MIYDPVDEDFVEIEIEVDGDDSTLFICRRWGPVTSEQIQTFNTHTEASKLKEKLFHSLSGRCIIMNYEIALAMHT